MRVLATIFVVLVTGTFANEDDQHNTNYSMHGIKVFWDTKAKLNYLRHYEGLPDFNFGEIPMDQQGPIEILSADDQLTSFKRDLESEGIKYEVFVEDVSEIIEKEFNIQLRIQNGTSDNDNISYTPFKTFPRYAEIMSFLINIAEAHRDVVELFCMGQSTEGRKLFGLKFSTGGIGKPALFIDAGIHGREWIAPTTALYAIKHLAEDEANRQIFNEVDIYIVPLLNPDGYEYTHLNESNRTWRKTRSSNKHSKCIGVDLNRNFDYKWGTVGTSTNECSEIYTGSQPFSEPESLALKKFILAREGDIKVYLTLHSYGKFRQYVLQLLIAVNNNTQQEVSLKLDFPRIRKYNGDYTFQYLLHPWGVTKKLPENEPILRCVAEKAAAELYKIRGTHYEIGSSTNLLGPGAGGSDDWVYSSGGVDLSYTMELPGGIYGFAPPPREIIPVGQETFEAIKVFVKYIEGKVC